MNLIPPISNEQQEVITELENNNNVIVNSVAGSGKTTCNLHIALRFPEKEILLLTYNSKLKLETRNRVKKMGLTNIETHSYHSFCVKYYDNKCFTDGVIKEIVNKKSVSLKSFKYDLIILDEAQDINPLYYQLICKMYNNNNNNENVNICVLGDEKQSIFDFNRADERFITFADKIFTLNELPWKKCKLSQSFRITNEMAELLNGCILNEERIFSKKVSNIKPRYIICDTFGDSDDRTFEEVKHYLDLGYQPNDIFILAPSLKSLNSPIRKLENKIKTELENIPVYVPTGDDTKLDSDILEGKLVFSTFHQVKGLERKVVIVFNFDNSYFEYFKKDANPNLCPNEMYVAATRSLECLSLFHHFTNGYLPFINRDTIDKYCHFENINLRLKGSNSCHSIETSPTDLLKHLTQDVMDDCYNYLDIIPIQDKKDVINIPLKTKQNYGDGLQGSESVSEITGVAIPSYYEFKIKGKMDIFERIKVVKRPVKSRCLIVLDEEVVRPDETISNIDLKLLTPEQLLLIANEWNANKSGFLFKIKQITNYDWLSVDNLQRCVDRLDKLNISTNSIFEKRYVLEEHKELINRKLTGYIDCVDNERLFEFKCVQNLEKEHYLQLAIYMYMHKKYNYEENIRTAKEPYESRIKDLKSVKQIIDRDILKCNTDISKFKKNCKGKTKTIESLKKLQERLCVNGTQIEETEKIESLKATITEDINEKFYLYNILTDEMCEIKCELPKLIKMMEFLIFSKYHKKKKLTDEEFLSSIELLR